MKKSTKYSSFKSIAVWVILFLILYFSGDLISKGQALNALTPYPVLGYCLWAIVLYVIWSWLVWPVISFVRLKSTLHTDKLCTLKRIRKNLKSQGLETEEESALYGEISTTLQSAEDAVTEEQMAELIKRYKEVAVLPKKSRELILRYSKIAGVAVVVSRNKWMDGIILLILQMKLIVELARLHGYRPSTVFNTLCFAWVVANSIINALLAQSASEATAEVAHGVMEDLGACCMTLVTEDEIPAISESVTSFIPFVGNALQSVTKPVVRILLEAVLSGTTVYITGRIFLRKLDGDLASLDSDAADKKLTFRDYLSLRKEGRKELCKTFLSTSTLKEIFKTLTPSRKKKQEE